MMTIQSRAIRKQVRHTTTIVVTRATGDGRQQLA